MALNEKELDYVLRRDLAVKLNVTLHTLWNWERIGKLPPSRRIGPRLKGWPKSEILAFLDAE